MNLNNDNTFILSKFENIQDNNKLKKIFEKLDGKKIG